ncbi:MAG: hypothetical protein AAGE90_14905 [Pseudomonadota bacterium]
MQFFPTVVSGDPSEGFGAEVIGTGVNGCGNSVEEALRDAATILQEVIDDAVRETEPVPAPGVISADDLARGLVAMLQARLPAEAA